jgi:glutathione S-transferase
LTGGFHVPSIAENYDIDEAMAFGVTALEMLQRELTFCEWLAGPNPTIADIAYYPHITRAAESEYELENYRGVYAWIRRIERLPRRIPGTMAVNDLAIADVFANRP